MTGQPSGPEYYKLNITSDPGVQTQVIVSAAAWKALEARLEQRDNPETHPRVKMATQDGQTIFVRIDHVATCTAQAYNPARESLLVPGPKGLVRASGGGNG